MADACASTSPETAIRAASVPFGQRHLLHVSAHVEPPAQLLLSAAPLPLLLTSLASLFGGDHFQQLRLRGTHRPSLLQRTAQRSRQLHDGQRPDATWCLHLDLVPPPAPEQRPPHG